MPEPSTTATDLNQLLLDGIRPRAGGRLSERCVLSAHESVVVRGKADSYYAWQLAIAACRQVLSRDGHIELDCELEVHHK